jgi:hypothetical protein
MNKVIATLIAGLFATAAFAQTPAATAPVAPTKAEAKHDKTVVKAEAKEAATVAKADAKEAKTVAKAEVKETKAAVKAETNTSVKADTKEAVKAEVKADAKTDAKPTKAAKAGATKDVVTAKAEPKHTKAKAHKAKIKTAPEATKDATSTAPATAAK